MNIVKANVLDDLSIQDYMYTFINQMPVIGFGSTRTVYAICQQNVIKHERPNNHQNMAEWHLWNAVKDTPLKNWFCPCEGISAAGRWLWMQRAEPVSEVPKRLPTWLLGYDLTASNFGLLRGKPVLVDYGYENLNLKLLGQHK